MGMGLGLRLSLGSSTGASGGAPVTPLVASYKDDFTTVSGTLNGRTIAGPLAQYVTVLDSTNGGSTVNALNVTTTGKGTLAGTSANSHAHGYSTSLTGTYNYMVDRVLVTGPNIEADVSANGTTVTKFNIKLNFGTNITVSGLVADVAGTSALIAADATQAGDLTEYRRVTIGGTDYAETRVNGRIVTVDGNAAYTIAQFTASIGASVTSASVSGSNFTAISQTGVISPGDTVLSGGKVYGIVLPYGTGGTTGTGSNANGTYATTATMPSSSALSIYSNTLNVSAVSSGTIVPNSGMVLSQGIILNGYHQIGAQISGTAGGVGKYAITGNPVLMTSGTSRATYSRYILSGIPATGNFGWNGGLSAAGIDSHEAGDMTKVSRIVITRPGHVQAQEADGTCIYRGTFEYTGRAPTALFSEIHLASDNSIVSGTAGQAVTFTVDDVNKVGTFTLAAFTPASTTTQYWARIYRPDAVDVTGAVAQLSGETGYFTSGLVVLAMGQSLMALAQTSTTTTTWAAATPSPWTFRALGTPSTWSHAATGASSYPSVANSPIAALFDTFLPVYGNPSSSYLATAIGGTYVYERAPGGVQYEGAYTLAQWSGMKISFAIHNDGQQDANNVSNYAALFQQIYPGISALSGSSFPVHVVPLAAMWGSSDAPVETMRRYQGFELPSIDSRYIPSAFIMDVQHAASDALHPNGESLGEMMRRVGWAIKHRVDPATYPYDRNGPTITGATRIDAQTVDVTVALGASAALSLSPGLGTNGKQDQWNGGLRFGTAVGTSAGVTKSDGTTAVSTITTEVYPTGCTITGTAGGVATVRFTFATNTFPGTAYVSGPYGSNPFNRTNDATVNASMATLASMLLGTPTGEVSIPVQPYWDATGNDYMVAS